MVNFTQSFVGGTKGGPVTNTTWNTSFHGKQEIVGDKFQLCAAHFEPGPVPSYDWMRFEACMNGPDGLIGIVDIPHNAQRCAETNNQSWAQLNSVCYQYVIPPLATTCVLSAGTRTKGNPVT